MSAEDLAKDFEELALDLDFVNATDRNRLANAIRKISVARDSLEGNAEDHMELESDLAWFSSKYEYFYRKWESELNAYKGGLVREKRKAELPAWAMNAFVESDPEYVRLNERVLKAVRLSSFLEKTYNSMRRRETIINYFRKLDGF